MKNLSLVEKIIIMILAFLIMGCASSNDKLETCIQAEGEWSYGTYMLKERKKIKHGQEMEYFMTMHCWGFYDFMLGFSPSDRFIFGEGIREDGRNSYYEEVQREDGTVERRFLRPYEIGYKIKVNSLDKPNKVVIDQGKIPLSSSRSAFSTSLFTIPGNFLRGEKLRIDISISAEDSFYEDYKDIGAAIMKDWYRRHH